MRFTMTEKVKRVRKIGDKMGYRMDRGKTRVVVGLGKLGKAMLLVEILEIAPKMIVVELKVAVGGLEELHWRICRFGRRFFTDSPDSAPLISL
ncbi:hypothetical protein ACOSQ3_010148 [Xanthoceras sorbifolium]